MPRVKLTDRQKKKIIADYASNNNYAETARMNGISDTAVRKIINKDPESLKKFEKKREENIKDILEYMDSIADDQKEIIDLSLKAIKAKLKKPDAFTNVKDIATVYGVIFDKALKLKEMKYKQKKEESLENEGVIIVDDLPK